MKIKFEIDLWPPEEERPLAVQAAIDFLSGMFLAGVFVALATTSLTVTHWFFTGAGWYLAACAVATIWKTCEYVAPYVRLIQWVRKNETATGQLPLFPHKAAEIQFGDGRRLETARAVPAATSMVARA